MKYALPVIVMLVAIAVAVLAASWPPLRFAKLEGGAYLSSLGTLVVFAVLIERTVEVFLTIWRAEEAYKLEAEVRRLISAGATGEALKPAQDKLIEFKTGTQLWALPSSFLIGLLIASFGVRVIGHFMELPAAGAANSPSQLQLHCFHGADIVLTAALLAGGADPIHKVMDTIRKFMEASSAKVSGTVKP